MALCRTINLDQDKFNNLHVHFLLWPIQFLSLLKPSWKIVSSSNGLDVMWWCCDVGGTLMTSWIIKRGLTTSSPVTECSRRGSRQRHLSLSRTSSQPSNQGIRSKQSKAKSKHGNFCTYLVRKKILINWGNYFVVLHCM